ncbi:ABC transporter permease [Candidatus Laterigemmans baculatus]|uniref:ABC transporter permease n=1 Tax=Candidatus Laterigemmans baculatus TaxID=2770505 RepID=UPI00193BDB8A|nr:ABC transporter permease [Candidatus Laterigemmans baculatus]
MWIATFKLAVRNLLLHKMRSALTLLGTILGVASVIAMLSVGEGSKQQALDRIRELGASNVIIRSVKPSLEEGGAGNQNGGSNRYFQINAYGLTYEDLRSLERIPTGEIAVPVAMHRKDVNHGRRRLQETRVVATVPELTRVKNLQVERGRFLVHDDNEKFANVAVLSRGAADALFGFEDPLGEPLLIGDGAYRVVGILEAQDSGLARPTASGTDDQNRDIFIPLAAARSRFGELQRSGPRGSREYDRIELSEITLAVKESKDGPDLVRPTAAMVRKLLNRSHPKKSDFQVVVPLELMAQAEHEKRIWNLVLGSIAGISLLVGGIGIMNIMLATVTERTREIGIRRAIGARRKDIIRQFLLETTVLSTTGGVLGIVLGVAIPIAVTLAAGVETSTSFISIVLAFGISVATGIIFGVYPAYKAAAMNPIEALRQQ